MKYFLLGFLCSQLVEIVIQPGFMSKVRYFFRGDVVKNTLPSDYYDKKKNFYKKGK